MTASYGWRRTVDGRSADSVVTRKEAAVSFRHWAKIKSSKAQRRSDVRVTANHRRTAFDCSALDLVTTVTSLVHLPSVMVQSISIMLSAVTG